MQSAGKKLIQALQLAVGSIVILAIAAGCGGDEKSAPAPTGVALQASPPAGASTSGKPVPSGPTASPGQLPAILIDPLQSLDGWEIRGKASIDGGVQLETGVNEVAGIERLLSISELAGQHVRFSVEVKGRKLTDGKLDWHQPKFLLQSKMPGQERPRPRTTGQVERNGSGLRKKGEASRCRPMGQTRRQEGMRHC